MHLCVDSILTANLNYFHVLLTINPVKKKKKSTEFDDVLILFLSLFKE